MAKHWNIWCHMKGRYTYNERQEVKVGIVGVVALPMANICPASKLDNVEMVAFVTSSRRAERVPKNMGHLVPRYSLITVIL